MVRDKFKGTRWSADEIAALKKEAEAREIKPSQLIRSAVLAELRGRDYAA
jgi:hypothetical protein